MAKVTKQGALLLEDDETASNYSDVELLVANGSLNIACTDTKTNKDYKFFVKV